MTIFKVQKVVSTLPSILEPNTIYAVRVGEGFDLYTSDSTGTIAHKLNGLGSTYNNFLNQTYLAEPYQVGDYYSNAILANAIAGLGNTNSPSGRIEFYPFFVWRSIKIDRLVLIVRSAISGLEYKFSLYEDNASVLNLISDTYLASSATTGAKEVSISTPLLLNKDKIYYLALTCNQFNNDGLSGFTPVLYGNSMGTSPTTNPQARCNRLSLSAFTYTNSLPSSISKSSLNLRPTNVYSHNYPFLQYRVSAVL